MSVGGRVRFLKTLVAAGGAAAVATALVAAPALADPIGSHKQKVTPAAYDIVSVGSESIYAISDQLSWNYNKTVGKKHSPKHPYYYSWDAVPSHNPNNTMQKIILKAGCKKNVRPDGSSNGIKALTTYGDTTYKGKKYPCIDFARSSRPRSSTDPVFGPGGIAFDVLWRDAVTYASTSKTNVPNNLSLSQLKEIFGCSVPAANGFAANTWGALLGKSAKGAGDAIDPIVPQKGSGTLSFWMETALGFTGDSEPTCGTAASLTVDQQPEENEGLSSVFLVHGKPNPNVIYPFSIGAYVAQAYHSAKCGKKPKGSQNMFGCNENGVFHLNGIGGTAPIVNKKTNPSFPSTFDRFLYAVVPYASTSNHIPAYLNGLLGSKGYFCKQSKVVKAYGFETTPLCGSTS
jgi:ABC-type phosphate transport system substrate-binding protein